MPDANGELLPGELGGGGYGALEGDLGHKLRPLAGFGRELPDEVEEEFELWDGVIFTPENPISTTDDSVVYRFPNTWNTWTP